MNGTSTPTPYNTYPCPVLPSTATFLPLQEDSSISDIAQDVILTKRQRNENQDDTSNKKKLLPQQEEYQIKEYSFLAPQEDGLLTCVESRAKRTYQTFATEALAAEDFHAEDINARAFVEKKITSPHFFEERDPTPLQQILPSNDLQTPITSPKEAPVPDSEKSTYSYQSSIGLNFDRFDLESENDEKDYERDRVDDSGFVPFLTLDATRGFVPIQPTTEGP